MLAFHATIAWFASVLTFAPGGPDSAPTFLPQLTAFELSSNQVRPGEAISASYEFVNRGTAPTGGECTVFVHVRRATPNDVDLPPGAGADFRPTTPTFLWRPGALVRERDAVVRIPKDLPPGKYRLYLGIYDPNEGTRHSLTNRDLAVAGGRVRLADFEVLTPGTPLNGRPVKLRWHDTAGLPDAEAEAAKRPPDSAATIGNGSLRVSLSATRPIMLGYQLAGGASLAGNQTGYPLRVRFGQRQSDAVRELCLYNASCFSPKFEAERAIYATEVRVQNELVAKFDLAFSLEGSVLRIKAENVREEPGYWLYDILLPQLVSAQAPAGQLVLPTQGGRLVHLDRASPGRRIVRMDWHDMDLCGAVVGEGCVAAVRSRNWDNEWEARVAGSEGKCVGGYAARLALRAEARGPAARIDLCRSPSVEVALIQNPSGKTTWIDAARWLRADVQGSPQPFYRDTFLYKIFCDSPGAKGYTTFEQALDSIRRVHTLAPWLKQVVYLVGWQYEGHDTGYPATDRLNPRLGDMATLRRVADEARKLGATLSFHDNFDDAYSSSPLWNESVIARNNSGQLCKGGVWAGGQSYILAFKKYAEAAGLERVRRTVAWLPARDSYHIDVLSAVPLRRDYNPQAPESTTNSLEGKLAILRQFNQLGIDVTSEGFTAPFVGRIGHSWHFWCDDATVLAGDESIPFMAMIYHGGPTTYGRGGKKPPTFSQRSALVGASYSTDWNHRTDAKAMADPIYLIVAPWTHLRDRKMIDFQRQGSVARVTYAANTFVEVDEASEAWRVVVDGRTLVENNLAIITKPDLVAAYCRDARQATIEIPAAWRGRPLRLTNAATGVELPGPSAADITLSVGLPAGEPILVRPATR